MPKENVPKDNLFYLKKEQIVALFQKYNEESIKAFLAFIFLCFLITVLFFRPPSDFPSDKIVQIEEGASLNQIIGILQKENIIRSSFWFKVFAYATLNQNDLVAGDYFFNQKLGLVSVLFKLANGEYGLTPESVTFYEGLTNLEIAQVLKKRFENFDDETFIAISKDKEGFLFPDTYMFLPNVGPREVLSTLQNNFDNRIEPFLEDIEKSGKTLEEIIIMASIIEREARTQGSRDIISGILWKRIEIDMPLQVDAVFPYFLGKNTYQLTLKDLESDSLYNTYKYKGLPYGPIANPGLSSIKASLYPKMSPYLFYLSDKNGMMHYAEDFEGHKRNRVLYLR